MPVIRIWDPRSLQLSRSKAQFVTKSFGGLFKDDILSLNDWDRSVCGSLGALLHSVCLCTTGLLATVGCSVGYCRRIRSKLLCTFYVHLATCKMGRKTRRNDSYIHSGKKRGTFYRTRPTAFTTTQMKQFELSLARIYNLSQDFKKSQEMLKTAQTLAYM